MDKKFKFIRQTFRWWFGRYGRLIGGSYWKVALNNEILVIWNINSDTKVVLQAKHSPEIKKLAEAVNDAKKIMGSYGGGTFSINEFGQVIVPSADGNGKRILVGEIKGPILLKNPFSNNQDNKWIDISDDSGFKCGDPWPFPYLGVVYRLSANDRIYYKEENEDESYAIFAPVMDESLIKKIRMVRPYGAVRFLVNPYGIVLTKKPAKEQKHFGSSDIFIDESDYVPCYIGRINYQKWFKKEE
ncbi:MAG: hypothetical protein ACPLPQ_07390 [Candidatus Saccharicenans sp.]